MELNFYTTVRQIQVWDFSRCSWEKIKAALLSTDFSFTALCFFHQVHSGGRSRYECWVSKPRHTSSHGASLSHCQINYCKCWPKVRQHKPSTSLSLSSSYNGSKENHYDERISVLGDVLTYSRCSLIKHCKLHYYSHSNINIYSQGTRHVCWSSKAESKAENKSS